MAEDPAKAMGRELAILLRGLVAQYRALHGGDAPNVIYASADMFAVLEQVKEPSLALKPTASGYAFDGIAIEPKSGQWLPFVLRP
jgi:hypothetical protein